MSTKLNELRLQVERLDYEAKEGTIIIETLREQNNDTTAELEAVKKQLVDLKLAQKDASTDDKEKRKQEKMAMMMAKFDTVGCYFYGHISEIAARLTCIGLSSKAPSPRRMNN